MEASLADHTSASSSAKHPLLSELAGVIHKIKLSQQPVSDGKEHLIPLCETLEAIFRNGLKKPNSWFGLNKQDYWSWIEPLQDYYFNEKQNPLLRQVVGAISTSPKLHTLVGRGRCFIRVALCQKLISVPIEHLVKNAKLTQYWYDSSSIIRSLSLRSTLMRLLFEVTEVDFELSVEQSSFLDETWVIPVFKAIHLPPLKSLDIKVSHVERHAVIVEIEKGCLLAKAGVEAGDVLDELCGEHVFENSHGRLKQILVSNSSDSTDLLVIKEHLPDGSPYFPITRRLLLSDYRASQSTDTLSVPQRRPSILVQSQGSTTEYTVVFLGRGEDRIIGEPVGEVLDGVVSKVLNSTNKPEEVVLSVSQSEILLLTSGKKDTLFEFGYEVVYGCGRGSVHQTCLVLLIAKHDGGHKKEYVAYVLETPSVELAQAICAHIAQGFNRLVYLRDKYS